MIATVAVIVFVEHHFAEQKDVWDRFIGKARRYVDAQVSGKGSSLSDLLAAFSAIV